jgi:hypothetical protein
MNIAIGILIGTALFALERLWRRRRDPIRKTARGANLDMVGRFANVERQPGESDRRYRRRIRERLVRPFR